MLAWKYLTEIKPLHLSATRIRSGGRLTFTGRFLQDTAGWKAYSHQTVLIVYRKPGAETWHWIVKATTNSAGAFRATIRDSYQFVPGKTWLKAGADQFRDVGRAVGHVRCSGESALMSSLSGTSVEDWRVG